MITLKEALTRVGEAKTLDDIKSLFKDAFGLLETQLMGAQKIPGLPDAEAPVELTEAAKMANPKYQKEAGYETNCQRCAFAFEALRRGIMVSAAPDPRVKGAGTSKRLFTKGSEGFIGAEIHGYHYGASTPITRQMLIRDLNLLPNGARVGIFWIYPGVRNGHVIVAEKQDGKIIFIDPQCGEWGDKVLGEATKENGYYWYRMDNLEIDETFEWEDVVEKRDE